MLWTRRKNHREMLSPSMNAFEVTLSMDAIRHRFKKSTTTDVKKNILTEIISRPQDCTDSES